MLVAGSLGVVGCAPAVLPTYIQDKYSYIRRFHAGYEEALTVIHRVLTESGWVVERKLNPAVYERRDAGDLDEQRLMIITEEKIFSRWFGKRRARMNIFLQSKGRVSAIEIRIIYKESFGVWPGLDYRQDKLINKILARIDELLISAG
jgi:hypothetical protein